MCQFGFHRYNESELFNDLLAWTSIERFNKTHFKSDGKIFVLEEYFNAEPVNSPNGEWQLFPDALKLDLKDNGSLLNSWSNEPGESLLMTY